jgi:hypothetical protein
VDTRYQLGELLKIQTCRNLKSQRSFRYVNYSCEEHFALFG